MIVRSMALDREIRSKPLPPSAKGISGLGATARVVQGVSHEFRKFASAMPSLIAVRAGSKTLSCGRAKLEANAGDMLVIPAHLAADIGNRVAQSGPYVADMLAFDPDFLRAHATAHPSSAPRKPLRQPALLACAPNGLAQAFRAAADALTSDPPLPPAIVAHRLAEPLGRTTYRAAAFVATLRRFYEPHLALRLRRTLQWLFL